MPHVRRIGLEAEDRAASYLQARGFTILTRRYKAASGEIDLVALDGEVLVFVEVKLRKGRFFKPEEALGETKRSRILRASESYLAAYEGPDREVRFDVVAIDPDGVRHHKEAFWPQSPADGD